MNSLVAAPCRRSLQSKLPCQAVERMSGNRTAAAELLAVSLRTVFEHLDEG
jgi:hypothetical protein